MAFGVILLVLGVMFLLDRLNIVDVGHLGDYWPLIFVAIGVGKVVQPVGSRGRAAGAIFIVIGAWWTLANLDLVAYDPLHLWPVILILIGGSMLWRAMQGSRHPGLDPFPPAPPEQPSEAGASADAAPLPPAPPGAYASDSTLSAVAVLGGVERKSVARDFRGASLTAIMGGCVIDLRQASIASGEAVIDAFAMWGGVEIRVPHDWLVVSKGMPLLGGFVDSTIPPPSPTGKVLVIRGVALMGAVETKN
jgi:predicted membrane protein